MSYQLHFAAQYLAMAGKSFLKQRKDDRHTNLGFDPKTQSLETWALDGKHLKLRFDLPNFQLKWSTGESLALDGKTHTQVVQWLQTSPQKLGLGKPYSFELHYALPFEWDDDFTFKMDDSEEWDRFISLRSLANSVLSSFLKSEKLQAEVRIWPHHFDTGAFVVLEDGSGKSIGLGMAIPDTLVNDHYFYISGYCGHDRLDTDTLKKLSLGGWENEGFKGAVLPASSVNEEEVVQFLKQAFEQLKS